MTQKVCLVLFLASVILVGCTTIDARHPDYVFYHRCSSELPGSIWFGWVSEKERACMDRLKAEEQERQQARLKEHAEAQAREYAAVQEKRAKEAEEQAKRAEYAKRRAARPKGACPNAVPAAEAEAELSPTMLPFAPGWVAVELLKGFVIFDNPQLFNETPQVLMDRRFLVAVSGIRTKVQRGDALLVHVPYLCELGNRVTEDGRGFPITVQLYKVIYEQSPACPDGLVVPGRSCVDGEVLGELYGR